MARRKTRTRQISQQEIEYKNEIKRKKLYSFFAYSISGATIIGLALMILAFWHANQESGVYSDCSKPENRNISYCRKKLSTADRAWKNLRNEKNNGLQFNLSN